MVIFDDADLEAAVSKVVHGVTVFAGQFCMTGSRAIVHYSIADRFRSAVTERLKNIRVGPASDPRSEMGPLVNRQNVERVNRMVEDAIALGAKVILRGGPATDMPLASGAFYLPTVLEVSDSSLPIVQQEIFGPVLTIQVFNTEAEAIYLANDSEYGLSASVWSRDIDRPLRVARALEAGTVWINDWANIHDEFEEGGFKQSGLGRLRGKSGLDGFLECKHIAFKPGMGSQQRKMHRSL
jgi:betaine-aldehyde dehydrogenase